MTEPVTVVGEDILKPGELIARGSVVTETKEDHPEVGKMLVKDELTKVLVVGNENTIVSYCE